jgi:hypothetical protein
VASAALLSANQTGHHPSHNNSETMARHLQIVVLCAPNLDGEPNALFVEALLVGGEMHIFRIADMAERKFYAHEKGFDEETQMVIWERLWDRAMEPIWDDALAAVGIWAAQNKRQKGLPKTEKGRDVVFQGARHEGKKTSEKASRAPLFAR